MGCEAPDRALQRRTAIPSSASGAGIRTVGSANPHIPVTPPCPLRRMGPKSAEADLPSLGAHSVVPHGKPVIGLPESAGGPQADRPGVADMRSREALVASPLATTSREPTVSFDGSRCRNEKADVAGHCAGL